MGMLCYTVLYKARMIVTLTNKEEASLLFRQKEFKIFITTLITLAAKVSACYLGTKKMVKMLD